MSRAKAIPNILRKVGRIIIEKSYSDATYTYDKGYLAEADLLANKTIIQSIKDLFPQDKIISEEDESIDVAMQNNEGYNWIIDPICGTTNYLHNIDDIEYNKLFIFKDDICNKCEKGECIKLNTEGVKICNICGHTTKIIVENIKSSYKEPPKDVSFYAYKRINHFREILAQFQAKETTTIPDELIEKLKKQIEKERISLKDLTNKKTKEMLKHLGYNKYYEHISYIKDKLGIRPPHMAIHLEETFDD